jgi:hypothetical protein
MEVGGTNSLENLNPIAAKVVDAYRARAPCSYPRER